jgi:hypothetical protein
MRAALEATAGHRGVVLTPLSAVVGELGRQREASFTAFCRRLGDDGAHLPVKFADVVTAVVAFVDPLVVEMSTLAWDPRARQWSG